jgi:hypothetical protein
MVYWLRSVAMERPSRFVAGCGSGHRFEDEANGKPRFGKGSGAFPSMEPVALNQLGTLDG